MTKTKNNIKKFELPLNQKIKMVFEHCELGTPIVETLKNVRFQTIDEFASRVMQAHKSDFSENQDFAFTIKPEPETINQLREYLVKNKKFVYNYTISQEHFINSHIYQLYLQYIQYKLTNVEKSVFLDAYISMITDLKGNVISDEKRKRLERRLQINQD